MNALIVDDSRAIRRILSGMLTDIGFAVAEASHGKEALAHLQAHATSPSRPHLVLVDWNMPEMNGLELVQAVRRDDRFASIPLMMVTTETEMAQVLRALEAGAQEYVMKPFTKEVIEEKLRVLGLAR
jgi:two-component system, chemotaxis family, chemotaxis protein CheY